MQFELDQLGAFYNNSHSAPSSLSAYNVERSTPLLDVRGSVDYINSLRSSCDKMMSILLAENPSVQRRYRRDVRSYMDAMEAILHSLAHVVSKFVSLTNVGISLNEWYYAEGRQFAQYSYSAVKSIVGMLTKQQSRKFVSQSPIDAFCTIRVGTWFPEAHLRVRTRIVPTSKLKDFLCIEGLVFDGHPYKGDCIFDNEQSVLRLDGKPLIRPLTELERVLPRTNELIYRTSVQLRLRSFDDYKRGWDFTAGRSALSLAPVPLVRVFKDNQWSGGRVYGFLQNLPKWARFRLTFNGEATSELDYSAMQVHMAYNLQGLACPLEDPYVLSRHPDTPRELNKEIFVVSIGASQKDNIARSVARNWQQKTGSRLTSYTVARLVDEFWSEHEGIEVFRGSEGWRRLQLADSEVALKVLRAMTDQGIPCMPLHDGFRVPVSHLDQLRHAMADATADSTSVPPIREVTEVLPS